MRVLISLVFLAASSALAVVPGGLLYVRSPDTALLKEPKVKAAAVMKLQPGDEVTWRGVSEKDKEFHAVERNGKKGFVHRSNLSPNRPQDELGVANRPMSQQAFAASGAATKDGDMGRGQRSWDGDAKSLQAAAELLYLEELNKEKATPAAVAAKNKELHPR